MPNGNQPRPVRFTIDGEEFETADRRQPASAVLAIAGLDPALYDLAEIRPGNAPPRQYDDADQVTIRPRSRFVSVRERADVA